MTTQRSADAVAADRSHRAGTVSRDRRNLFFAAVFVAALAATPLAVHNGFLLHGIVMTCLWAGLALAWNILAGFTGQFSFGHAAFFGIGAYTMAILYGRYGVTPWFGMLVGGVVSSAVAALIGVPAFRLRGPYFSLATLALAEVARILAIYWESLTGGAAGFFMPMDTGLYAMEWATKPPFLWLTLGFMTVVWGVSAYLKRSRLGYFMAAVREDEDAAAVAGINTTAIKMRALMISAFFTGIGGSIYACYITFLEPNEFFGMLISVQFLILTIVGGVGTLTGPIVGAFLATPLGEVLRSVIGSRIAGGLYQLLYGFIFLIIMIYLPKGVGPTIAGLARRLVRWRQTNGDN